MNVNLESSTGPGTHWAVYFKKDIQIEYFDCLGHLQPSWIKVKI